MSTFAIGVDIGRTKIAVGVVDLDSPELVEFVTAKSPGFADQESVAAAVAELVKDIAIANDASVPIGVGTPEVVNWKTGEVLLGHSDNAFPLRAHLGSLLDRAVVVDSDANVAAWAEVRCGSAAGFRDALVLTVGTGVGGGLVLNGEIYRGALGYAGEVGHLVVSEVSKVRCNCGNLGCLEVLASGSAIERLGMLALESGQSSLLASHAVDGRITGHDVFECAKAGDRVSMEIYLEIGNWLGVGVASLVNVLDPAAIVVGGGVSAASEFFMDAMITSAKSNLCVRDGVVPPIHIAHFTDRAGVVGAAMLAADTNYGAALRP